MRQWDHKWTSWTQEKRSALLPEPEASWRTVRQEFSASRHSPLSRNLSNYSNNLESRLDVYDIRYLGYNTWFFKKISHKMTMLTNSIQTIKKIQDFHKQSMHYFENHFVLKSLPLDKQVCNISFHISRINDV
jgi:hypothetical protein